MATSCGFESRRPHHASPYGLRVAKPVLTVRTKRVRRSFSESKDGPRPRRLSVRVLAARRIAEAPDDVAAGYRVKFERVHEVVLGHVLAQRRIICGKHVLR